MSPGAPRIYCLPATRAPVVAVLRRGPSAWWHVGRWVLDAPVYEPGAWLRAQLYPRRCDVSPDGRWLSTFVLDNRATWDVGMTYCAISRLPWLTALAAWPTCGTWTRGLHFVEDRSVWSPGDPDHGDASPLRKRYGLETTAAAQFAAERRRGWTESADSPARPRGDMWDQKRNARLEKPQPGGDWVLGVQSLGWAGGEFDGSGVEGLRVSYWLEEAGDLFPLDDAQWADWDSRGRLLVATRSGSLEIRIQRGLEWDTEFHHDLAALEPAPGPAPDDAAHW